MTHVTQLEKYDDSLDFRLPGSGSAKDDCGKILWIGHRTARTNVFHGKRIKSSCHRRECPVCYPDWAKREALASLDRLDAYQSLYHRRIVHYVVSPPQSKPYSSLSLYRSLRQGAYQAGKLRGIKGGVMIFHTRASRYDDPKRYTLLHCSDGPHFHVLGDGWLSNVKEFYLEDGWVIKNLRVRSKGSEFRTLLYILEHAAIGYPATSHSTIPDLADPQPRVNAVTWFGTMSYNKLKIEQYTGSNSIYCPICEAEIDKNEWFVMEWIGDGDPPDKPHDVLERCGNSWIVLRPYTGWYGI